MKPGLSPGYVLLVMGAQVHASHPHALPQSSPDGASQSFQDHLRNVNQWRIRWRTPNPSATADAGAIALIGGRPAHTSADVPQQRHHRRTQLQLQLGIFPRPRRRERSRLNHSDITAVHSACDQTKVDGDQNEQQYLLLRRQHHHPLELETAELSGAGSRG